MVLWRRDEIFCILEIGERKTIDRFPAPNDRVARTNGVSRLPGVVPTCGVRICTSKRSLPANRHFREWNRPARRDAGHTAVTPVAIAKYAEHLGCRTDLHATHATFGRAATRSKNLSDYGDIRPSLLVCAVTLVKTEEPGPFRYWSAR